MIGHDTTRGNDNGIRVPKKPRVYILITLSYYLSYGTEISPNLSFINIFIMIVKK